MAALEKESHHSDPELEPLTTPSPSEKGLSSNSKKPEKYHYRERQLGIWTLYYPVSVSWTDSFPTLGSIRSALNLAKSLPVLWKFLLETLSVGPLYFAVYCIASVLLSIVPSIQLHNKSRILEIAEKALLDHERRAIARKEFDHAFMVYVGALVFAWAVRKIRKHVGPILEQRISLHFEGRFLAVQTRLDLTSAENPEVKSKLKKASSHSDSAWGILEGLFELIGVAIEFTGHISVLAQIIGSFEDAKAFGVVCILQPLALQILWAGEDMPYYAMVTNINWLRMKALYELGTSSDFKKEVLSGGLEGFINSQHAKDWTALGDTYQDDPYTQINRKRILSYDDIGQIFDSIPLLMFAWGNIQNNSDALSLTSLVMVQQSANAFSSLIWELVRNGRRLWGLFESVALLYQALDLKPTMLDGDVLYPDDKQEKLKGTAIEFKDVSFTYPATEKPVLQDMSFKIDSGQLCVIVGENGCGKSTTINLITRMYDSTSGSVIIDGHQIGDYNISSLRAATNVMYQDYKHLPLTVRENILLGCPTSTDPTRSVEAAAKLGGAFDFIQKLPLQFDTNIDPQNEGHSNGYNEDSVDTYKPLIDAQKPTKLSGGEWQRLALSRTFMKNSESIRLLCYDEPSASLDPKAEYEIFERLRDLRGERTMIFVTHRFGHLTKHADLILYMKEGSIIESGTHKELLALGGEYAKMYMIQSQAFID